jgi:hypothetical protein
VACAVDVVASLAAVVAEGRWSLRALRDLPVDAVVGVSYAAMGAVVLAGRRTSRRLGWLLVGIGAAAALTVVTTAQPSCAEAPTMPARLAVHLQSWLWVPGFVPLVTLLP